MTIKRKVRETPYKPNRTYTFAVWDCEYYNNDIVENRIETYKGRPVREVIKSFSYKRSYSISVPEDFEKFIYESLILEPDSTTLISNNHLRNILSRRNYDVKYNIKDKAILNKEVLIQQLNDNMVTLRGDDALKGFFILPTFGIKRGDFLRGLFSILRQSTFFEITDIDIQGPEGISVFVIPFRGPYTPNYVSYLYACLVTAPGISEQVTYRRDTNDLFYLDTRMVPEFMLQQSVFSMRYVYGSKIKNYNFRIITHNKYARLRPYTFFISERYPLIVMLCKAQALFKERMAECFKREKRTFKFKNEQKYLLDSIPFKETMWWLLPQSGCIKTVPEEHFTTDYCKFRFLVRNDTYPGLCYITYYPATMYNIQTFSYNYVKISMYWCDHLLENSGLGSNQLDAIVMFATKPHKGNYSKIADKVGVDTRTIKTVNCKEKGYPLSSNHRLPGVYFSCDSMTNIYSTTLANFFCRHRVNSDYFRATFADDYMVYYFDIVTGMYEPIERKELIEMLHTLKMNMCGPSRNNRSIEHFRYLKDADDNILDSVSNKTKEERINNLIKENRMNCSLKEGILVSGSAIASNRIAEVSDNRFCVSRLADEISLRGHLTKSRPDVFLEFLKITIGKENIQDMREILKLFIFGILGQTRKALMLYTEKGNRALRIFSDVLISLFNYDYVTYYNPDDIRDNLKELAKASLIVKKDPMSRQEWRNLFDMIDSRNIVVEGRKKLRIKANVLILHKSSYAEDTIISSEDVFDNIVSVNLNEVPKNINKVLDFRTHIIGKELATIVHWATSTRITNLKGFIKGTRNYTLNTIAQVKYKFDIKQLVWFIFDSDRYIITDGLTEEPYIRIRYLWREYVEWCNNIGTKVITPKSFCDILNTYFKKAHSTKSRIVVIGIMKKDADRERDGVAQPISAKESKKLFFQPQDVM